MKKMTKCDPPRSKCPARPQRSPAGLKRSDGGSSVPSAPPGTGPKYYAGDLPVTPITRLVVLDHPERLRDLDQ